jgi:hypothetical protein
MSSETNGIFTNVRNEIFKQKCYGMWKIFIVIIFMIILYWFVLLKLHGNEKNAVEADFMNHIVFETPNVKFLENCCSWWPISHFILFTVIGFLFPECDLMAILAGIGWELAEVGVYYTIGQERQGVRKPGSGKIEYSGSWVQGSFKDIFMNIAGFYTGKAISIAYERKCENKNETEIEK